MDREAILCRIYAVIGGLDMRSLCRLLDHLEALPDAVGGGRLQIGQEGPQGDPGAVVQIADHRRETRDGGEVVLGQLASVTK